MCPESCPRLERGSPDINRRLAVVFDLDGTLLDTAADITAALNHLLNQEHLDPLTLAQTRGFIGDGLPVLVSRAFAANRVRPSDSHLKSLVARFLEIYESNPAEFSSVYPGAPEVLRWLTRNNFLLALCTNKPTSLANALLRHFALDQFFSLVMGADCFQTSKPDPVLLEQIMRELAVTPSSACLVGDGRADAELAFRTGVKYVAARYGYYRATPAFPSVAAIDSLRELPRVLLTTFSLPDDRLAWDPGVDGDRRHPSHGA